MSRGLLSAALQTLMPSVTESPKTLCSTQPPNTKYQQEEGSDPETGTCPKMPQSQGEQEGRAGSLLKL